MLTFHALAQGRMVHLLFTQSTTLVEKIARQSLYVHNAGGTKEAKEDGHGGGEEKKSMDRKKERNRKPMMHLVQGDADAIT